MKYIDLKCGMQNDETGTNIYGTDDPNISIDKVRHVVDSISTQKCLHYPQYLCQI